MVIFGPLKQFKPTTSAPLSSKILHASPGKIPSLVLTGTKDQGSTVKMSQNLSKDLINSQFFKITNAKHLCSIEYSLNVNMIIKKFLNT